MKINHQPMFSILYSYLCSKLVGEGLSRAEYDGLKYFPVGHHSLADFVDINIKMGNYQWSEGKLINIRKDEK